MFTGAAPSSFGLYGVLAAASLVFFAFIGFDVVATAAEETKNPKRDLPRGIFGSLAIVTVLYVLVTIVLTGDAPYNELGPLQPDGSHDNDTATLATAFTDVGVDWAANVIAIGALAGLTTVVLVLMLGQSRIIFAMSRDGLLPRGHGHGRREARHPGPDHHRRRRRGGRSSPASPTSACSRRWSTSARCSPSCWSPSG